MSTVAFSDLDRTLIYSASAAGIDPAVLERDAVRVEDFDGRPLSYVTRAAAAVLGALVPAGRLVPVTTRTVAQTRRVLGPFAAAPLAVCTNGGRLLRDGVEDRAFTSAVDAALAGAGAPPDEVEALLRSLLAGAEDVGPLRSADGLFAYAVCADRPAADRALHRIGGALEPLAWRVSVQGRKLYAVPGALSKAAAVARVADELGAHRVVAAGDSLLDAAMLEAADAAIRPAHGELHEAAVRFPHLTVTAATGLAAGEEIAVWLAARIGRPVHPAA